MAHLVETMAYAGEAPWHRLGIKVEDNITTDEMLVKAGLDWSINKEALLTQLTRQQVPDHYALVRSSDNYVLGACGKSYKPVQPKEVLSFFHEFVEKGGMKMETAGSLSNGRQIFALASIQESFVLGKQDKVDGYLLFSSPNIVGKALRILFTPVRVVCNNTLTMALSNASGVGEFRLRHTQKFDPEMAKAALGLAKGQLGEFEKEAEFLSERKVKSEQDLREYFMQVWPTEAVRKGNVTVHMAAANDDDYGMTRTAESAMTIFKTQPGASYFPDSWWNAFNTVTYIIDHVAGRSDNNRLRNAWFGHGERLKRNALHLAIEKARAA
jgi:phage/plasmid-like protein (TIGR03299 family)